MKKTLLLPAAFVMLIASGCQKDYNCTCVNATRTSVSTINTTKKKAQKFCDDQESNYTQATECTLSEK